MPEFNMEITQRAWEQFQDREDSLARLNIARLVKDSPGITVADLHSATAHGTVTVHNAICILHTQLLIAIDRAGRCLWCPNDLQSHGLTATIRGVSVSLVAH